jgi:hypothetical protein
MKSYYSLSATAAIFMMMSSSLVHAVVGSLGGSSESVTTTTTTSSTSRQRDLLDGKFFSFNYYNPDLVQSNTLSGGMDYLPITPINNNEPAANEPKYDTGLRGSVGKWKRYKSGKKSKKEKKRCKHKKGNHHGHRYPQRNCNPNPDCINYAVPGRKKCCSSTLVPSPSSPPTPSPALPAPAEPCFCWSMGVRSECDCIKPSYQDVEWCTEDDEWNNDDPNYNPADGGKPNYDDPNYNPADGGKPNYDDPNYNPAGGPSPSPPTSGGSTATDRPTITSSPTSTAEPSNSGEPIAPTDSPVPSSTSEPSALRDGAQSAQGMPTDISQKNYCQVFPAKFEALDDGETAIVMWSSGTDKDLEANAIAAINSIVPTPILESSTSKYKLDVDFKIKPNDADISKDDMDDDGDFDLNDVGLKLDDVVSPPMVLVVAGCEDEARKTATDYYFENNQDQRKIQTIEEGSGSKLAVMRDWICGKFYTFLYCTVYLRCRITTIVFNYCIFLTILCFICLSHHLRTPFYSLEYKNGGEEVSCATEEGMCVDVSCSTSIHYIGDLGYDAVQAIIAESVKDYFGMIDNVSTWYIQQGVDFQVEEVPTGSDISEINDTVIQEQKSATKAGPFIGAAAGLLALLLLVLLFVRRRNRYDDEVSHLKMDENADDDDTFVREFGLGGDGGSDDNSAKADYNTRDIHIVGEGDSVISHWTGYTARGKPSDGKYETELHNNNGVQGIATDVHQCSSATCEICARNRQAGLSFISTGAAGANDDLARNRSLPSDASREYPIEDTVEL